VCVLQNSLCGIELPGAQAVHVFLKFQVVDGEVEGEQHQDRNTTVAGEEKRRSHVSQFWSRY
jgi:hypothetical protein